MLEGKGVVKETDMPMKMQIQAMDSASEALDLYDVCDCISIASHIKKEFDNIYGGGWQCVDVRYPAAAVAELDNSDGDDIDGNNALSNKFCFSNHILKKIGNFF
ncbi:unnamed protein product [Camellia sinensis]